jgi:hypothetical protein
LGNADCGLRIDTTFNLDFAFAVEQIHKSAISNPQSAIPSPHSLLLLPCKRPFAEARQTDLALHRLAVSRSGVIDDALNLAGGFEREFDLVALDRSGQVEFSEQAFVSAGQLFALLFEGEAGIA